MHIPFDKIMQTRVFGSLITLFICTFFVLWAADLTAAPGEQQKAFKTPEAAVESLLTALKGNDTEALLDLFGHQYKETIDGVDKVAARENRKNAYQAAQQMHALRSEGPDKRILVIGNKVWPMPIPIVRDEAGWYFDTEAGIDEILYRLIGENELAAIDACLAYAEAQREYASKDRDGDGVRQAALRLASSPGKKDGLYWEAPPGSDEPASPLQSFVAEAQDYLQGRQPGNPFKGYYFKILTRQGKDAPGGAYSYVVNGRLLTGFALVAYPADYQNTGIMTFIINHYGTVYEKDLGEDTSKIAQQMQEYNPDDSWTPVSAPVMDQ
jgi:hypothetical protein